MTILIQQATLVAPSSSFHLQVCDVLLDDGTISRIDHHVESANHDIIPAQGYFLSLGWFDLFCQSGEPGQESTETLETLAHAAWAGGFTEVALTPNLYPVTDKESQVKAIQQRAQEGHVCFHPIGAVTRQTEGKELAEMYELDRAGAPAFSDGWKSIQSGGLLLKALQYLIPTGKTLIQLPDDQGILPHGLMHEGLVSTQLGLPGRPTLAEFTQIDRDIEIARYTGGKIHFTGISCIESIERIRAAKATGVHVTCSVTPAHLFWTDEDLRQYSGQLKTNPPLRTTQHRDALRAALLDGTIDAITTHHHPRLDDHKSCEFEYAKPGMLALETAFSLCCTALGAEHTPRILEALSSEPRRVLGVELPSLQVGSRANLTLVDPHARVTYSASTRKSRAFNSPAYGLPLQGRVIATFQG